MYNCHWLLRKLREIEGESISQKLSENEFDKNLNNYQTKIKYVKSKNTKCNLTKDTEIYESRFDESLLMT